MDQDWAWREMKGATALEVRQRGSLADVCAGLAVNPGVSFTAAAGENGRQAFGRLGTLVPAEPQDPERPGTDAPATAWCPSPEPAPLLAGHVAETVRRCAPYELVVVAQDTSEIHLPHCRIPLAAGGLGSTNTQPKLAGLLAHTTFVMSPQGLPLGVLDLALWARDPEEFGKRSTRKQRKTPEKESQKWLHGVSAVEAALPAEQRVLVIQDREGDVFALLAQSRRSTTTLLLRVAQDRRVTWQDADGQAQQGRLFEVAARGAVVGAVWVEVPRRKGLTEDPALLEVRATQLEIQAPHTGPVALRPRAQVVTVIQARELAPPAGLAAIQWLLVTTHPVTNGAEAIQMVRYYALRWRIERLHYVLKSGLAVERVQHASRTALDQALALYYLVAWHLLWLTYVARCTPDLPAETVFTGTELKILRAITRRPVRCLVEAVVALGVLGGYTPYRTALPPGAKVLWRGYRRLQDANLIYELARKELETYGETPSIRT